MNKKPLKQWPMQTEQEEYYGERFNIEPEVWQELRLAINHIKSFRQSGNKDKEGTVA